MPLNDTDAGSNFRLRHAHCGGVPRPIPVRAITLWRRHARKGAGINPALNK